MIEARSDAVKSNIAQEPGISGPWIKAIWSGQTGVNVDILGISELKWTGMGELTQMTIISTTVDRNPSEEME